MIMKTLFQLNKPCVLLRKQIFSITFIFAFMVLVQTSYAQPGIYISSGAGNADPSAMLDISSINKGLLIPRVALTSITDQSTIPSPANSLLVFATGSGGLAKGYYYWDAANTTWVSFAGSNSGAGTTNYVTKWTPNGNTLGNSVIYDNGSNVGIGTTSPVAKLDVAGLIAQTATGQSVFVGQGAGATDDLSNNQNVFIGYQAGNYNSTGQENIAVGHQSLFHNTTGNYNTASGYQTLWFNTTGSGNTVMGHNALNHNTTGQSNTAIGISTLYQNVSGTENTALGKNALFSNTTGSFNTAVGSAVLIYNTSGGQNTAMGGMALRDNTTGYSNIAIGNQAMLLNTIGYLNVALGSGAMYTNTTGKENTATGYSALHQNSVGTGNTANGYIALYHSTTANNNTAMGYQAMYYNSSGSGNVAIGVSALYSSASRNNLVAVGDSALFNNGMNATGIDATGNAALGSKALFSNTTGSNNTANGYRALYSNTTGSNNTAVGYLSNVASGGLTNATAIGANAQVSASNSLVLGNNANVGIGTTAPAAQLHTTGTVRFAGAGTPGAGKVLSSDATGNATWQTMAALLPAGTAGQTLRHDGTVWTANSILYNNGANVGIGTSSPVALLTVNNSPTNADQSTMAVISLQDNGIANLLSLINTNTNLVAGKGASITFFPRGGTSGVAGELGIITENGSNSSSSIFFKSYNFTTGFTEKMRILSNGNVGIGTTSPGEKLTIFNGVGNDVKTSIVAGGENKNSILFLGTPDQGWLTNAFKTAIIAEGVSYWSKAKLHFCLNNSSTNAKTADASISDAKMTILSSGDVGIGTTSPVAQLHTTGTIRFSGAGTPGAGKVLSSDASGNATWQSASSFLPAGTVGQTLRNDGSDWTANSILYNDGTNVGIGTTSPERTLDVAGATRSRTTSGSGAASGQFQSIAGGTAQGQRAVYSFYPTFENTAGDNLSRRAADILSGFSTGNWGHEFLAFHVGLNGTTNDAENLTTERMRISGTGNVGIGTTYPSEKLQINGTILIHDDNSNGYLRIENAGNTLIHSNSGSGETSVIFTGWVGVGNQNPNYPLEVSGSAAKPGGGSWTASSDLRLKQDVKAYTDGLNPLLKINPVSFHYNEASGYDTKPVYVGVIAQELKEIAPYMVNTFMKDNSEYYSVDNSAMIYMLINSTKEQQKIIESQQKQIDELKKMVEGLLNK